MRLHEEKVIFEKAELDVKISELGLLIYGEDTRAFNSLDPAEQLRLEAQFDAMATYSRILGERIANFPAINSSISVKVIK